MLNKHTSKDYIEYARLIKQENDLNATNSKENNFTALHKGKFQ